MSTYDLIVVGEGITGLACARHAASLGLKTATTEGNLFGGLVINIAELEGYDEQASGVDIAAALMESNAAAGVENLGGTVSAIEAGATEVKVVADSGEYRARAVVIATGARMKKLGVRGEEEFDHRGVSQCADCDGPMFQGEHVVVVGGGDAAFQEAAALAHYAGSVTVLLRGAVPRASGVLAERVRALPNVSIRAGVQVEEILGGTTVEGVTIRAADGAKSRIDCAGVFVFVGLTPNSEIAPADIKRDAAGAIETDASFQTAIPRIFAAGAVRAGYSGKLVDAVREARSAAENAARTLAG
ncbi:MAG: NAD(P)/FAD-dependent oxidoreductase [Burkholderiales bacterium]|nr:NAD(P)/FAD-dependent oxidoreductase [Burkholderiales bacterium]